MAKRVEIAEQQHKPFKPEELLSVSKELVEQGIADKVITGQQVVLRGLSKGLQRICIGDAEVVDPNRLIDKTPFRQESGEPTPGYSEDQVRQKIAEHQGHLRKIADDLSKMEKFNENTPFEIPPVIE
ncbi:MAG: hypothetical protein KKD39_03670 [Candidatus Altiarchaeota archaeon]|nr:hypothetical protein [Candidatus Altiarchaeota archaeon]